MRASKPEENFPPVSANQPSPGAAPTTLRILLENGKANGGRLWRVSVGFLLHAAVLSLFLLLPLMYTESVGFQPHSPQGPVVFVEAKRGEPEGTPEGTGGGSEWTRPATHQPDSVSELSDQPLLVNPWQSSDTPDAVPGVGPGGGPGEPALGIPEGSDYGIPGGQGSVVQPPALPEPVVPGGRIERPRLVRMVKPAYPWRAKQAHVEGEVLLEAVLDVFGRVQQIRAVSGHPWLREAALKAVEQWVYEPTYLNDRPVPVRLKITINFRLKD